ncbi:MAG: hypothetical protein C4308_00370 [Chitinophagaceae bacterium]
MKKFYFVVLLLIGFQGFSQLTPGNLVIYRVGDGTAALTSNATAVFLDEYTTTGTLVQSIALPTTVSGSNKRITASGTATSEGLITRSTDGQFIFVTGYDADPGSASITSSTSTTINRVVGKINISGTVDATTALTDAASGGNPRSVVSTNGTDIWITGSTGGIRYTTLGATTSTQLNTTVTNLRQVNIFNSQLYVSSSSGTIRLGTVGSGTPTTSGQVITNLPGFPTSTGSPYGFFFADLDAGVAGVDVVYVADDGTSTGFQKYSLVGGNWVSNGSIAVTGNSLRGLTATVSGNTVTLYGTNGTSLVKLVDASGYNATISGTVTTLATAPANTAFRGVTLTPVAAGPTPTLTATPTTLPDFGNVNVGTNTTSQSFVLSGANLTGAPGNITVTAPSTDFQVSNNNSTWGPTTTIAYSSATLSNTNVYVRFTPQSAGFKSGNVTISGGGASSITVAVSGTGVAAPIPTITTTPLAPFGNVCINTTAGPNSFTINGSDLTNANITVGPLAGYTFSTTSGGTYTNSLTLTQPGGTYSQVIYVKFTPTAVQSYNGNIPVSGGGVASTVNVAASGAGINTAPAVTTDAASSITYNSATAAGSITATGCSAVTAYGIEYSTTNNFPTGTGTQVASTNLSGGNFTSNLTGLAASTVYYYRAYATNSGGTTYGAQQSFTTAPLPIALSATPLTAFGAVCVNNTAGPNSFVLNGQFLTTANINVGPLTGYTFSTTSNGTYSASLSLTQPGGTYSQTIYVRFTPTLVQSYNGNIPISGGGAPAITVAASGSGINTPATVTTGNSSNLTNHSVTLAGSIGATGCSNISDYGFEISGVRNFANGTGTKVSSSNLSGGSFSVNLDNLVQGAKYYYKAYATNLGGTSYGAIDSFTVLSIKNEFTIYPVPAARGQQVRITMNNLQPGYYGLQIINAEGRLVHQVNLNIQSNFINQVVTIPATLQRGMYQVQLVSYNKVVSRRKIFVL